jgi:hypothetical protein
MKWFFIVTFKVIIGFPFVLLVACGVGGIALAIDKPFVAKGLWNDVWDEYFTSFKRT